MPTVVFSGSDIIGETFAQNNMTWAPGATALIGTASVTDTSPGAGEPSALLYAHLDPAVLHAAIPSTSTITSVTLGTTHNTTFTGGGTSTESFGYYDLSGGAVPNGFDNALSGGHSGSHTTGLGGGFLVTRDDIDFDVSGYTFGWYFSVGSGDQPGPPAMSNAVSVATLTVVYSAGAPWWVYPTINTNTNAAQDDQTIRDYIDKTGTDQPTQTQRPVNAYRRSPSSPGPGWTPTGGGGTTAPPPDGWFWSSGAFSSDALAISGGVPSDPRNYSQISDFAAGSAFAMGGMPGSGANFRSRFVFAGGGYTSTTQPPPIRIFDGISSRILTYTPPITNSATVYPKAIMAMLTANDRIYLSTLDSGTSDSDWVGRVFEVNVESATIKKIGSTFPTGHLPYALAWHNGKLWCGTNRKTPTNTGKLYSINPLLVGQSGLTEDWVEQFDLSTASVGGVASLMGYNGSLYIGSTANTGTFAKIIKRSSLGVYTTSNTGSGGTAKANNAFLTMLRFGGNLYATYWNDDTTRISEVRKFDDTTWSTVYSQSGGSEQPMISLFSAKTTMFAVGGGASRAATLASTVNGTSWTALTSFLPAGFTAAPVFGVVIL